MGIYASEEWKDVVGWEDRYEVSNFGSVRSKSYLKTGGNVNGPFSFMTTPSISTANKAITGVNWGHVV